MKITEMIIKIPEETRARLALGVPYMQDIQSVCNAISEGTILSKGHGRLIDADEFARFLKDVSKRQHYNKLYFDDSLTVADVFDAIYADLKGKSICKFESCPTILEADKEENEK